MSRFGITRVANLTGLDNIGLPVYTAIHPNARSLSTSQGKGLDADSAKASALMESIEAWHAEHVERTPVKGSYSCLHDSLPLINLAELPVRVGSKVRLDGPIEWVEGYDILQREPRWVPYEAVTLNFVFNGFPRNTFLVSSNGLASGNHMLEAITHGLCELIERDAEVIWELTDDWRLIDLDSVNDCCCSHVIELVRNAGLNINAWDITSDVGVPSFSCFIWEDPHKLIRRPLGFYGGAGCHPSSEIALLRALCEAIQSRLTLITGSRDDIFPADYKETTDNSHLQAIADSVSDGPTERFSNRNSFATDTFEADIAALLFRLRKVGMKSVVVVDLTKSDIGIPVAKVIVPGLEGPSELHCRPGKRAAQIKKPLKH